jgi:hypothetical protein
MKLIETKDITQGVRMPVSNRSIDHINDAIKEVASAAALSHKLPAAGVSILSGVERSGSGYTAGWAWHDGELYYVEPSSGLNDPGFAKFKKKVSYRAGDPVLFTDNNLRNIHRDNRLVVVEDTDAEGFFSVKDAFRVNSRTDWQTADLSAAAGVSGTLKYRKDTEGRVEFKGYIERDGATDSNWTVFTLPAEYRPDSERWLVVSSVNPADGQGGFARIKIESSGRVSMWSGASAVTSLGNYLDGFIFHLRD